MTRIFILYETFFLIFLKRQIKIQSIYLSGPQGDPLEYSDVSTKPHNIARDNHDPNLSSITNKTNTPHNSKTKEQEKITTGPSFDGIPALPNF